ncbi:uncharacterized protein E0L32_010226 [Thyridium curvatum]|uniref:Zn(2)-C6 fungal-type domain-containing protein n=1 Tax=Thyridium curvatum TaxID=1093900 RepID=A0A507AN31_9PEZI|nr:uncharacterized protein E0L32_010226 [Thyridium curvatum]TPX08026.1 hypothetical protein E0L32_010226 [Thyridium curvatum]
MNEQREATTLATSAQGDGPIHTQSQPKRIRLSLACNNCRRRKVRCDTEQPKCRNCWLRDEECETTDPRYPDAGALKVRRWATADGLMPGQNPAATHRNQAHVPKHGPASSTGTPQPSPSTLWRSNETSAAVAAPPETSGWSPAVSMDTNTSTRRDSIANTTGCEANTSTPGTAISWVSRGYQHSVDAENGGQEHCAGHDPDLVVNTDNSSHRVKYMGGSSLQCLAGFVDIYLRRKRLKLVTPIFRCGMRHVEEVQLPLMLSIPSLPSQQLLRTYLDTFFDRVWPLYPVVNRTTIEQDIQHFQSLEQSSSGGLLSAISHDDVPRIVIVLTVLAIGADEGSEDLTDISNAYLTTAHGLFAHLVCLPYLSSVQALLLLAVGLRSRAKDGQAWHIVGQAIRVAHSIGLHRHIRSGPGSGEPSGANAENGYKADRLLQSRVWWSCFALEKLMELETGRPSAINDEVVDQPLLSLEVLPNDMQDFFTPWVSLSRILGQISRRLYMHKPSSAWSLISEIGKLDQQLLEWAKALPETLKPGHEAIISEGTEHQQHLSTFLALQYYQAQISVLRASIVFPINSFTNEVKHLGSKLPSYMRLLQAESICTGAARATVRQVLELADHGIHSNLLSSVQPHLAAIVISLHILRHPGKRMVRSDMELIVSVTHQLETQFQRNGQHPNFIRGFETLRASVAAAVYQGVGSAIMPPSNNDEVSGRSEFSASLSADSATMFSELPAPVPGIMLDMPFFDLDSENLGPFEEFWNAIGPISFADYTDSG